MEEYARLSCHIVEDFYGSFLALIFRRLAHFGRLSLPQIAQKCRLPLRQIKKGVAALVQLRLVSHHTKADGLSMYEAKVNIAYNTMRTGRVVELAERKMGPFATEILTVLATIGSATANELRARVLRQGESSARQARFRVQLERLISLNYIEPVREPQSLSEQDDGDDSVQSRLTKSTLTNGVGKKAKDNVGTRDDPKSTKSANAAKLAKEILDELDADGDQGGTTLIVDYSSLIVNTRNQRVADVAEKTYGKKLARILRAVCSQTVHVDPKSLPARLTDDSSNMVQDLDMPRLHASLSEGMTNGHAKPNGVHLGHGYCVTSTYAHDHPVHHSLATLAEGSFPFIVQNPSDAKAWSVNRSKLNNFLWDQEMHRLIGEKLTAPALRIVRILAERGKLEEKTMLDVGLLNAKELRKSLSALQTMGFVEIQEVPKDPQRQPKSTIFLYFYDAERLRKVLLDKLYKAMSRLYQRMHLERQGILSTLTKVDMYASIDEHELLPAAELQELQMWRQKESWLLNEIRRIDDSVIILHDI